MSEKVAVNSQSKAPEGFASLGESITDVTSSVIWGPEGSGKTLMILRSWPLPIGNLNLDRQLDASKLDGVPEDRRVRIHVKNLRDSLKDIDALESERVKQEMEQAIMGNLEFFKGGTILIDGGSTWSSILKLADPKIGVKMAADKKWNPREKEQINAYLATFVHRIADQGIHLVITAHSAPAWEMQKTEEGKSQLVRTKRVYPKLDQVLFEQTQVSLLLFKRCTCGSPLTGEDGACPKGTLATLENHIGRVHMTRIVGNKYATATEGMEFEDFGFDALYPLCFGRQYDG